MPESWRTYRRALGSALGFHIYSTQSASGPSAAATQVVLPDLIDSNLEVNFLDNSWEFQPVGANAGEVRRVSKGGLLPASGIITLSRTHTAVTSSSAAVEIYGVLPPTQHLGRRGLLQAANLALKECWAIDMLSITGVSSAYQYPLSTAYPWLTNSAQIVDVYVRRSGEPRDSLAPQWRFISDVDTPQFEFPSPWDTTDTIKPVVYRPLDTWIEVNSTWADSTTPGLVNDTDRGLLPLHGMLAVGLYWCYEFLATEGDVSQRSYWRGMADRQRIKANNWKRWHLPQMDGRDVHAGVGRASLTLIGNGVTFDAGLMDW